MELRFAAHIMRAFGFGGLVLYSSERERAEGGWLDLGQSVINSFLLRP